MTELGTPFGVGRDQEIAALIEILHSTEQRLEALTAGEVDTVANRSGRTILLQHAQDELRLTEADKQVAILNALPAHIALLDAQGVIVTVNEAWRRFAAGNQLRHPGDGVGLEYAQVCLQDGDPGASGGRAVAAGVRSVLAGTSEHFSREYPCHSPTEQRWFLMTVTPLASGRVGGAIVMHVDITARARAERTTLRTTELLQAVADGTPDIVYVKDVQGRYLFCNRALVEFTGLPVDRIIGHDDTSLYSPAEARVLMDSDRRLLEAGLDLTTEKVLTGPGGPRIFDSTKALYRSDRGAVLGLIGIARDVTDRKKADEELGDSQALLGMAGRVAGLGGWSVDLPPTRVVWSTELAAMHQEPAGFSPTLDEAFSYYAPEHVDMVRAAFAACIADGTPFDVEHEIVTAKGKRIWVRAVGEAVRDANGVIRRVQGALQDLSERKQAERLTSRLATRLTNTLESISDGFFTVDRAWRYTFLNGQAERLMQSRGGLIGRVMWDVYPETLGTVFESGYRQAMDDGRQMSFEAFYQPWDKWVGVDCFPSDEGLSVYFRDVSVKRAARLQLELLESSVARLHDIVLITEASPLDAPGPRIVFVNDAFIHVTGYAREEVLGRSPRLLSGPLTDKAELRRIRAALERHEPVHAELLNYHKSGMPYWIELDIVPVGATGEGYTHFVAIERDITERKRDQDALHELNAGLETRVLARTAELNLARELAEQANRAKSLFLATMSHEIRTPMNGVVGMIDVLEQTSLRPSQIDMVRTVRESANALLTIVDDVLDFSKIEAGQFHIDSMPMELAAVVEGVCDTLDVVAHAKGVTLRLFTDPALPSHLLGDAARLRQVLLNLIGNAIKFSSGQGHPGRVSVRAVHDAAHTVLELVVADNGIGMDESTVSRLFEPFTQADAGTTRRFGGTGLGLSICCRLVKMMNGSIAVRSGVGLGSTFTVRLPMTVVEPAAAPVPQVLKGLNCLLIGAADGLADDLAVYLSHGGATVRRVRTHARGHVAPPRSSIPAGDGRSNAASLDFLDMADWLGAAPAAGCVVVVADPGESADAVLAACRGMSGLKPPAQHAFVGVEEGRRSSPRADAADRVTLDGGALHRGSFLRAIARATGRAGAGDRDQRSAVGDTLPIPLDGQAGRSRDELILVAEDNEINQKVLRKQLSLLGFKAEIAADGQQALALWRGGGHALLLTDLHMPEMDGYTLAAAVRSEEPAGQRLPIIALTANALRDEEMRCRAAGMDGYLTKPVRLVQLGAAIEAWLGATAQRHGHAPAAGSADTTATFSAPADLNVLTALIGDDPQVIDDVLRAFRSSTAQSSGELTRAVADGAMQAVADVGHKLKSAARSIGALRLGSLCADLEEAGENKRAADLAALMPQFDAELRAVCCYLDARSGSHV